MQKKLFDIWYFVNKNDSTEKNNTQNKIHFLVIAYTIENIQRVGSCSYRDHEIFM